MEFFVYGTLVDPHHARRIVPDCRYGPDATLEGLHRVEGEYPTLAPGGEVEGRILVTGSVDAMDEYEGVDDGLYVRVPIPRAGDEGDDVAIYVGEPDRLGVADGIEWPGDGDLAERVREYVDREGVRVRVE